MEFVMTFLIFGTYIDPKERPHFLFDYSPSPAMLLEQKKIFSNQPFKYLYIYNLPKHTSSTFFQSKQCNTSIASKAAPWRQFKPN